MGFELNLFCTTLSLTLQPFVAYVSKVATYFVIEYQEHQISLTVNHFGYCRSTNKSLRLQCSKRDWRIYLTFRYSLSIEFSYPALRVFLLAPIQMKTPLLLCSMDSHYAPEAFSVSVSPQFSASASLLSITHNIHQAGCTPRMICNTPLRRITKLIAVDIPSVMVILHTIHPACLYHHHHHHHYH